MNNTAEFLQEDDNGIVPTSAKWEIEYTRTPDIPGNWLEPPEPGGITIISKTLTEVLHYYNKQGYELKDPNWGDIERHLRKWLDEEDLVECCVAHWESLDDEGRRVA